MQNSGMGPATTSPACGDASCRHVLKEFCVSLRQPAPRVVVDRVEHGLGKTPLIEKVIRMAARNYNLVPGVIFHCDRDGYYTSGQFVWTLESLNVRHSVGRTGVCFDKAMVGSFFGVLQTNVSLVWCTPFADTS